MTFYPRGYVDRVQSFYLYTYTLKRIIKAAKYQSVPSGLKILCNMCPIAKGSNGVFVPVPMFPIKQKQRGYNQAEVIARMWSYQCNAKVETGYIQKIKNTKPQAHCTALERYHNLHNAFSLNNFQTGTIKEVTIIDDVWTTGTTIQTIARIFKEAGVKKVYAITLARARDG